MKTEQFVSKSGDVKVKKAVSAIHTILNEISDNGKLNCQMNTTQTDVSFVFISNGVCVTCQVQEAPVLKGGRG